MSVQAFCPSSFSSSISSFGGAHSVSTSSGSDNLFGGSFNVASNDNLFGESAGSLAYMEEGAGSLASGGLFA